MGWVHTPQDRDWSTVPPTRVERYPVPPQNDYPVQAGVARSTSRLDLLARLPLLHSVAVAVPQRRVCLVRATGLSPTSYHTPTRSTPSRPLLLREWFRNLSHSRELLPHYHRPLVYSQRFVVGRVIPYRSSEEEGGTLQLLVV